MKSTTRAFIKTNAENQMMEQKQHQMQKQNQIETQNQKKTQYQMQTQDQTQIQEQRPGQMQISYIDNCSIILEECSKALRNIDEQAVHDYIAMILKARRVFFIGVGRVLLSLEAIAKRYAHLGIDTVIVGQITEPAITGEDVLVIGSGSGETLFPVGIAKKAKVIGAKIIHVGSNTESSLKEIADLLVRIPVKSKMNRSDEIQSAQPMTSLFEQALLLFGDTTAMMIIKQHSMNLEELWQYHANLE